MPEECVQLPKRRDKLLLKKEKWFSINGKLNDDYLSAHMNYELNLENRIHRS